MSNYEACKIGELSVLEAMLAGWDPGVKIRKTEAGFELSSSVPFYGPKPEGDGRTVLLATIEALQQTESIEDLRALVNASRRSDFRSPHGGDRPEINAHVASYINLVASHIEIAYAGDIQAACFQAHHVTRNAGASAAAAELIKKVSRPSGPK